MKLIINILIFLTISLSFKDYGEHILIGDSQTYYLSKYSTVFKKENTLCKSGVGVDFLIGGLQNKSINPKVKSVLLLIGTNDGFVFSKPKSEKLIRLIRKVYPNSTIYFIKGSWGWGNNKNINKNTVEGYSNKMKNLGCEIISQPIGFGDPHKFKKEYKLIAEEIKNKINEQSR